MHWEKKICIRITTRRLVVGLLVASILANLVIVGVVFGATDLTPLSTSTAASQTGLAASATNTLTSPAQGSDTPLPPPSQTASLPFTATETLTATPTETPTVVPTLELCTLQSSWPLYTVRPGDTLDSLARATASSVEVLVAANCLKDPQLSPGQALYLPRLPYAPPTFTASPTPTDTPSATSTPTGTPSATPPPTVTLDVRIGFIRPDAVLDTCPTTPENFSVSVSLESAQEIRSVTALFNINGVPAGQVAMSPNGAAYSGTAQVRLENYPEIITYSFIVFDSLGNRAESDLYYGTIICSFGLAR